MADIESTYAQTLVFDLTGFSLANMVSKMKDIFYMYYFIYIYIWMNVGSLTPVFLRILPR